jgi:hypothetical protein
MVIIDENLNRLTGEMLIPNTWTLSMALNTEADKPLIYDASTNKVYWFATPSLFNSGRRQLSTQFGVFSVDIDEFIKQAGPPPEQMATGIVYPAIITETSKWVPFFLLPDRMLLEIIEDPYRYSYGRKETTLPLRESYYTISLEDFNEYVQALGANLPTWEQVLASEKVVNGVIMPIDAVVNDDGTVTLSNGEVVSGLAPGDTIYTNGGTYYKSKWAIMYPLPGRR